MWFLHTSTYLEVSQTVARIRMETHRDVYVVSSPLRSIDTTWRRLTASLILLLHKPGSRSSLAFPGRRSGVRYLPKELQ